MISKFNKIFSFIFIVSLFVVTFCINKSGSVGLMEINTEEVLFVSFVSSTN